MRIRPDGIADLLPYIPTIGGRKPCRDRAIVTIRVTLRADLHWLSLTSSKDLWYLGGGAYDNKVFGYTGRPANGVTSLASLADVSADWQLSKPIALNFYYSYAKGKSVAAAIYPADRNLQYGYVEFVYHWSLNQKTGPK